MEKDMIFLSNNGLTSTSANHIANLAKELIQSIELKLNSISFYQGKVTIIGSENYNVISEGTNLEDLDATPKELKKIAEAKSLIAWLREGIKAKDNLLNEIKHLHFTDYAKMHNIEIPTEPEKEAVMTEDDYISTLSIKERNRYYSLQTKCAVLGKYIHPEGYFANARKKLADVVNHPHAVSGTGRDSLLYTYTPTISSIQVEEMFFTLQSEYRTAQAELNSILHKMQEAITFDDSVKSSHYEEEYTAYSNAINALQAKLSTYKVTETKRIADLKITIPNELKDIYNIVSALGK